MISTGKSLIFTLAFFLAAPLIGCSGGDGGTSLSDAEFNARAAEFVRNKSRELNVDLTMVKTATDQRNFVVVYNPLENKYQVYNVIDNNNVVVGYDYTYNHTGIVDVGQGTQVIRNGDKYFTTIVSTETAFDPFYNTWITTTYFFNVTFEETSASPKDLEALYAEQEDMVIGETASNVRVAFSLNEERSVDVARLMTQLKKFNNKSMTPTELNMFSKELLNVSYNEIKAAALSPHSQTTEELLERAARANEISTEHAKAIIENLF